MYFPEADFTKRKNYLKRFSAWLTPLTRVQSSLNKYLVGNFQSRLLILLLWNTSERKRSRRTLAILKSRMEWKVSGQCNSIHNFTEIEVKSKFKCSERSDAGKCSTGESLQTKRFFLSPALNFTWSLLKAFELNSSISVRNTSPPTVGTNQVSIVLSLSADAIYILNLMIVLAALQGMLECKTTKLYCPTYVTIKYSKSPWFWRLPSIYYLCTATWFIGLHKRNWNETSPGTGPFGFHFYRTSVAELCGGFPSDHRLLYLKRVCGRGTKPGTWAAVRCHRQRPRKQSQPRAPWIHATEN